MGRIQKHSFCLAQGHTLKHPEKDCNFTKWMQAKNEQPAAQGLIKSLSSSSDKCEVVAFVTSLHEPGFSAHVSSSGFYCNTVKSSSDIVQHSVPQKVHTRYYYNSGLDQKVVQGLMVRGLYKQKVK